MGTEVYGTPLSPLQVSAGRFTFALCGLILASMILRPKLQRPHVKLHLTRTLFGWLGVTLMFAAAARIPLSDATSITFLNPVFTMMFAIPILGGRVGPIRWAAAGIAVCGAFILLRPGPGSFQPAAMLALGAAVVLGLEAVIVKRLSSIENPLQILLVNNVLGAVLAVTAASFVWITPSSANGYFWLQSAY